MDSNNSEIKYAIWKNNESEYTLFCSKCDQGLINLVLVEENDDKQMSYKALCPKCKENSFVKKLSGKVIFIPLIFPINDLIYEESSVEIILGENNG